MFPYFWASTSKSHISKCRYKYTNGRVKVKHSNPRILHFHIPSRRGQYDPVASLGNLALPTSLAFRICCSYRIRIGISTFKVSCSAQGIELRSHFIFHLRRVLRYGAARCIPFELPSKFVTPTLRDANALANSVVHACTRLGWNWSGYFGRSRVPKTLDPLVLYAPPTFIVGLQNLGVITKFPMSRTRRETDFYRLMLSQYLLPFGFCKPIFREWAGIEPTDRNRT